MDALDEALARLADEPPTIVCLPDLFLDHFVEAPAWPAATAAMEAVHARGGGNLQGFPQRLAPGGNAANTARALARLGVRSLLVARTSQLGRAVAETTLAPDGVVLDHLASDGELALTVAMEYGPAHTNVMLNHGGSVADFGPHHLSDAARAAIRDADAVLVANWTNTREHGTALAAEVLDLAHEAGTLTYLDTSDPRVRLDDVPALVDAVARSPKLDVFAMNESELQVYAGEGPVEEAGARLAAEVHAAVEVHTAEACHSWHAGGHTRTPCFKIVPRRATGAGDVWNAGNLVGHVLDLPAAERLRLANAVAACYLQGEDGAPPTADGVRAFVDAWGAGR